MDVKSESRVEAGGAGFVKREFEVPAEGWRPGEVPEVPSSPGEWAALDWEELNASPDGSRPGLMLVHRYLGALRQQVAARGLDRDHIGAAELAMACPLTDSRGEPLLLGLAEVHSRLALAGAGLAQARCQASPPHLHDVPQSDRRSDLLRFVAWASAMFPQQKWSVQVTEALVDRYLRERP